MCLRRLRRSVDELTGTPSRVLCTSRAVEDLQLHRMTASPVDPRISGAQVASVTRIRLRGVPTPAAAGGLVSDLSQASHRRDTVRVHFPVLRRGDTMAPASVGATKRTSLGAIAGASVWIDAGY